MKGFEQVNKEVVAVAHGNDPALPGSALHFWQYQACPVRQRFMGARLVGVVALGRSRQERQRPHPICPRYLPQQHDTHPAQSAALDRTGEPGNDYRCCGRRPAGRLVP